MQESSFTPVFAEIDEPSQSSTQSAPNLPVTKELSCGKVEVPKLAQDVEDESAPLTLTEALESSNAILKTIGQIAQPSSKRLFSAEKFKFKEPKSIRPKSLKTKSPKPKSLKQTSLKKKQRLERLRKVISAATTASKKAFKAKGHLA